VSSLYCIKTTGFFYINPLIDYWQWRHSVLLLTGTPSRPCIQWDRRLEFSSYLSILHTHVSLQDCLHLF